MTNNSDTMTLQLEAKIASLQDELKSKELKFKALQQDLQQEKQRHLLLHDACSTFIKKWDELQKELDQNTNICLFHAQEKLRQVFEQQKSDDKGTLPATWAEDEPSTRQRTISADESSIRARTSSRLARSSSVTEALTEQSANWTSLLRTLEAPSSVYPAELGNGASKELKKVSSAEKLSKSYAVMPNSKQDNTKRKSWQIPHKSNSVENLFPSDDSSQIEHTKSLIPSRSEPGNVRSKLFGSKDKDTPESPKSPKKEAKEKDKRTTFGATLKGGALGRLLKGEKSSQDEFDVPHIQPIESFGVSLSSPTLLKDIETGLPLLVVRCIWYLNSRALIPSHFVNKPENERQLKSVRDNVRHLGFIDFSDCNDPCIVITLLKAFVAELPEPLIAPNTQERFLQWFELEEQESYKMDCMCSLIYDLPKMNRELLQYLVQPFHSIVQTSEQRSEFLESISNAFGPLLLRGIHSDGKEANVAASIMKYLISHYRDWEISTSWQAGSQAQHRGSLSALSNEFIINKQSDLLYYLRRGDEKPIVCAATVEKLIEKSMDEYYNDGEFLDTLFLTHSYFMTEMELLQKFIALYNKNVGPKIAQKKIRLRILSNLRHWLTNHSEELKKQVAFVELIKDFVHAPRKFAEFSKEEEAVFHFLGIVADVMEQNRKVAMSTRRQSTKIMMSIKIAVANLEVTELDPTLLAEQITLIDHELLKGISPNELLQKNFDNPQNSPGFTQMVNKFNEWTLFVVSEVVRKQKAQTRALVIVQFIKVAHKCLQFNNFHSCYAIIAGLNYAAVSRLKLSWEKVPKKFMLQYKELCQTFEMSHNFKTYRRALKAASPPIVPYLGLYPKDLTSLEEMPDMVEHSLVNFDKMRVCSKIVEEMRTFQARGYTFNILPELATFLRHLRLETKESAFRLSLILEPRKKE